MAFICNECEKSFSNGNLLNNHLKLHCELCKKLFLNVRNVKEHMSQCAVFCSVCNEHVPMKYYSYHKRTNGHREKESTISVNEKIKLRSSDFNERIESYIYSNANSDVIFPEEFFKEAGEYIVNILEECRVKHLAFKFNMELECDYLKFISSTADSGESQKVGSISHITKMTLTTLGDDLQELYEIHAKDICTKMSEFQERDSGWSLTRINCLNLNINQVTVFRGSAYISLPSALTKKSRTFLNILNHDDYCFKWCVIAWLLKDSSLPNNEMRKPETYKIADISSNVIKVNDVTLNFSTISFPLKLKDIKIFEKNNEISVNVFGYDNNTIVGPYYLTKEEKSNHINLLLLTKEDKSHYVLIRDMSR